MLQKFLTGEVGLFDAFCSKLGHNLRLGGNCGMVSAGHPQGVLAHHSGTADKDVLDSIVQHMPHVKHSCHVWRRNDNRVGFAFIRLGMKQVVLHPVAVPFVLNLSRVIFRCKHNCRFDYVV